MPRRFFRKLSLKREHVGQRWFLAPFRHLLHDPNLWGIRRRSVVPAFSLGLFMPFPGHILISALLALALRVNIPVAIIASLVSNPLTLAPMYYTSYQLGVLLLGWAPQPVEFEMSIKWVTDTFVNIWQPLLLGCVLLGALSALLGYIVLDLLWRASLADYVAARRKRDRDAD